MGVCIEEALGVECSLLEPRAAGDTPRLALEPAEHVVLRTRKSCVGVLLSASSCFAIILGSRDDPLPWGDDASSMANLVFLEMSPKDGSVFPEGLYVSESEASLLAPVASIFKLRW
jgi:hypothetical protein